MAMILGVFDLIAYAIPGSLYLATFTYVAHRAGWIDAPSILGIPSLLLLIALAVATFLVGQAAQALGGLIDRTNPFGSAELPGRAKEEFLRRNPVAASRRFLQVDPFTLLAALEADDNEAAAEVARLRGTGQMLSRSVPALVLGVLTAVVEAVIGGNPLFAGLSGLALALVAVGCLYQAAAFRRWAIIRTYELSYWDDEMDGRLSDELQR
jgi:hypothetical protein